MPEFTHLHLHTEFSLLDGACRIDELLDEAVKLKMPALAVTEHGNMHEFAIYSVIPPEGCAAILWRDAGRKVEAAEALKLTAPDLLRLGLVDEIVSEPAGGSHTNPDRAAALLDTALARALADVSAMASSARLESRYQKWRKMGSVGIAE